MGLVLLDMEFQVQKAFGIRMPKDWIERLGIRSMEDDATLGQYHELILRVCAEQNVVPPADSWAIVAEIASQVSAMDDITPATTLREIAPGG